MAYELLGILFSLISSELSNIKPNIYVIIFGIISIVIFIEELNYLKKIEQEAKRKKIPLNSIFLGKGSNFKKNVKKKSLMKES